MDSTVNSISYRTDGVFVIGGSFSTVSGVASAFLAYITSTGTRDSTYSIMPDNAVWSLSPQTDGKVILGGNFTTV